MTTTQVFVPYSPTDGPRSPTIHRMSDPKERFYRHFQTEITDQIDGLATLSPVAGERRDCIDHVLAGVSRLSNEVADAKEYIPAYDQRAYGQAIKALTDNLNKATGQSSASTSTSTSTATISSTTSKPRFQFKPRAVQATTTQKETTQYQPDPRQLNLKLSNISSRHDESDGKISPSALASDEERDTVSNLPHGEITTKDYNKEMATQGGSDANPRIRKPSFSTARTISIYDHTGLHIILPSSASRATASGSLADLDSCVVDMTVPTSSLTSGVPFAGLVITKIHRSLLVCGTVTGPVHITGVKNSIIVVAARQVRIHECENVDLYLHCGSHPIIEDCSGMRFAPIPSTYYVVTDTESWNKQTGKAEEVGSENQWDQVDDFKWLKAESSPNWRVLPQEARIADDVWQKTVSGNLTSRKEILRSVGVGS
ncbi:tubulin binding cofactor C [Apiospora phragmitis]|uniref:Tubulin binding cofactor C n=1 Tax=Apiospora phragmitis TaxID=2905665 RepID=A0ABR1W0F8_9PEZI